MALLLVAKTVDGVDFGAWARHVQNHGDWISLDFRDPVSGLFLAARAATEDSGTAATLTLTAAPANDCRLETVIVVKQAVAADTDSESIEPLLFTTGKQARRLRARAVTVRDDAFSFYEVLDSLDIGFLSEHPSLQVNLPGRSLRFSLRGFAEALDATQIACRSFMNPKPDGGTLRNPRP